MITNKDIVCSRKENKVSKWMDSYRGT